MHELSLAQNLIDQLLSLADEHQATCILKVNVVIGPFSGIVADSFAFGFNALKGNHDQTREAELILEKPAPTYYCLDCRQTITAQVENSDARVTMASEYERQNQCPHCSSLRLSPEGGSEMILKQIEME